MSQDTDKFQAIRSQTLDQIEEIRLGPKPTYWLDGQRVHWQEYVESLQKTVDWCDLKLSGLDPFVIRSEGGSR